MPERSTHRPSRYAMTNIAALLMISFSQYALNGPIICLVEEKFMRALAWSFAFLASFAFAQAQDKPDETLGAVVAVSAKIQANARSVETLGAQRRGTGALVRPGYVLTIGYLVIEAE